MTRSDHDTSGPDGESLAGERTGWSDQARAGEGRLLDDPRVIETLVRHDEAPEDELRVIAADPGAARVLGRLRQVDDWLREALTDGDDASAGGFAVGHAPDAREPDIREGEVTAEELYDYGAGPGATTLDPERRSVIEAYLAERPEEAAWVQGLSRPIPAPLDVEPLAPDEDRIRELRQIPGRTLAPAATSLRRAPSWFAWAPLAAAALIVTMVLGGGQRRNALDGGLPESPVLRSASSESLLFPRGRVLAPVAGVTTYASRPLFEVTPIARATTYRFELRKSANGAFEEGEIVWSSTTMAPTATSQELAAGTYEWSAWAQVDALERSLGTLQFVVVEAPRTQLLRIAAGVAPDARAAREGVRQLHADGFLTDARHRARSLPPGEDRAKYLSEDR